MQLRIDFDSTKAGLGSRRSEVQKSGRWGRGCASLAFIAAFTCVAQDGRPAGFQPDKAALPSPINQLPDANAQMENREKQTKTQKFEAANGERKKQISEDSTKLLTMAIALKAEVDKTTKDTLSLNVIRKAEEIEKLAHSVKEKMKLTVGPG
jgi:hypothetical protein